MPPRLNADQVPSGMFPPVGRQAAQNEAMERETGIEPATSSLGSDFTNFATTDGARASIQSGGIEARTSFEKSDSLPAESTAVHT